MSQEVNENKIYVVGHKNPDTDSICSAIAYAALKKELTGKHYVARRAGRLNEETQYVLEYFGVEVPKLLSDLRVQVRDVDLRRAENLNGSVSIKTAWAQMKELNIKTLPIGRNNKLEGLITVGDIARSYMDVYDSNILARSKTQYRNIASTIDGKIISGNEHSYVSKGKVAIAASSRQLMSDFVDEDDLVILGDRIEAQQLAIDINVSCMVVCGDARIPNEVLKQAKEKEIVVIASPHDTFTVARLINQSIPVRHFMTKDELITFYPKDYVDDVKEVMARKKYRDFPVVDINGDFQGFISRRRLLNCRKKQVILVDHNEESQAVDNVKEAEILEIIDHHRLGTIQTMSPVFFRNQPLGCTATIIYQMYQEAGIKVEPKIAGLLCSAIVSDTLLFRSPTCTPVDEMAARALADIAGIDIEKYAMEMFSAGSNLKDKSDEEIFYQDFKRFTSGKVTIGVGQITSLNGGELDKLKGRMEAFMEKALENNGLDMIFFMLTNILTETTELICEGQGALQLAGKAFHQDIELLEEEGLKEPVLRLPGVVSRKKQLIPELMLAEQE